MNLNKFIVEKLRTDNATGSDVFVRPVMRLVLLGAAFAVEQVFALPM